MRILLTGATGYIAQRLLPVLLGNGHEVICCVRDQARFDSEKYRSNHLSVIEVDFLKPDTLQNIPSDIDAAYYLIHSMSSSGGDFEKMEEISAINFKDCKNNVFFLYCFYTLSYYVLSSDNLYSNNPYSNNLPSSDNPYSNNPYSDNLPSSHNPYSDNPISE